MQISTHDLVGLICALTAWMIAIIYFHTHPLTDRSPTESIMGWILTDLTEKKNENESALDNENENFKKTVHFPVDAKKFPEGTPDFSEAEISQSESVHANYSTKASYAVDGLVV